MLTFNKDTHVYRWNGRHVPSVTQVIHESGCSRFMFKESWWYMSRGAAVHEAAELWDRDDLKESSVDPQIAGYLAAYRQFRQFTKGELEIIEIEQPGYHVRGYAGTPDRVVLWRGQRGILDLKTGTPAKWHALQTAAYLPLVPEATVRLALYLGADGRSTFNVHEDRADFPVFASALAVWQWKERNGLLTRPLAGDGVGNGDSAD